jgi:hypothetical protein
VQLKVQEIGRAFETYKATERDREGKLQEIKYMLGNVSSTVT